jgi:hypothetical protein
MFELQTVPSDLHATAKFWLDVVDEIIKASAVFVGAAWTWMNYRRSRTYARKLELQLSGSTFRKHGLYIEITAGLKNLGASRHPVQQEGTTCEILAIAPDLSEIPVRLIPVFELENWIEPGESISDLIQYRIELPPDSIVWLRVNLRIVSKELEWNTSRLIQVA